MKATVTINSRGVVTLPAKLRRAAGIRPYDQMIVETTPKGLLLRRAVTLPIEIYTAARLKKLFRRRGDSSRRSSLVEAHVAGEAARDGMRELDRLMRKLETVPFMLHLEFDD